MIFGSKKYCINPFIFVSLLTIILTGCGGGGSEDSGPTTNSVSAVSLSSTPVAIASSSPATSSASTSKSSTQATVSEPAKTNPSSSAPSSYARSSRANDPTTDLDDYDPPPLEDNEELIDLPPTVPKLLQVDMISADGVVISWGASTDDIGLSRYEVRRDGVTIGTSIANKRSFEDTGLKANTYYTYTVRAVDITGNRSSFSDALIAKTALLTGSGNSSISQTSSSATSHSSAINQSQSASSASQMSTSSTAPSSSPKSSSSATPNSSSESSSSTTPNSSSESSSSTTPNSSSESSSGAAPNSSSESSSSAAPNSSSESSSSSTPSSSSASSKAVRVEWITPSSRENGTYLELDEIGGYEIRYRPVNSSFYLQEIITDRYATYYERTDITTDAVFQIAVFDTNGLYSRFIQLTPH